MSIPRFIAKTITTEVPLTQQLSASAQTVPLGGTLTVPRDFNIQLASFLNPFGLATPGNLTEVVGGHVAYGYVSVLAGAATGGVGLELHANHASGGAFQLVEVNILSPGVPGSVTAGNAAVGRYAAAGAPWELRFILRNTGTSNATVDYAVALRVY